MIGQILEYINNYFEDKIVFNKFIISGGAINADFLMDGQYFRICDSVFNDGVYKYPTTELKDEIFTGAVWALAVPPSVSALADEISDWVDKYGEIVNSPYQSESFGGYSYSKAQSSSTTRGGDSTDWKDVFRSRLNKWRKIRK